MTVEQKLKQIIGEQTFAVVLLQTQIEELTAENAELKKQLYAKEDHDGAAASL